MPFKLSKMVELGVFWSIFREKSHFEDPLNFKLFFSCAIEFVSLRHFVQVPYDNILDHVFLARKQVETKEIILNVLTHFSLGFSFFDLMNIQKLSPKTRILSAWVEFDAKNLSDVRVSLHIDRSQNFIIVFSTGNKLYGFEVQKNDFDHIGSTSRFGQTILKLYAKIDV